MALSLFKSANETPWDRFSHAMDHALTGASGEFRRQHHRRLALGSPVRIAEAGGDVVRLPIEVRGGVREYAIAYLHVVDVREKPNSARLQEIARDAVQAAEPFAESPPAKPGETVLRYP